MYAARSKNMVFKNVVSTDRLRRLKDHKYNAEGSSIMEIFLQPFWKIVLEFIPLWVAPNLLTFIGLSINVVASCIVAFYDENAEGKVMNYGIIIIIMHNNNNNNL